MAPSTGSSRSATLTYVYLAVYIALSTLVIMFNKWVLSPKYFGFPFPIALTMIHMGFSGVVAFFLVRVFKLVLPVSNMTLSIYLTCVVPISACFAASLWFGNAAYLYLSVAFVQMLKSLMPVFTFFMAVLCGTDRPRVDIFLNLLWISGGVAVASYGEIHLSLLGTAFQVLGMGGEALRLVLTQVLLQKKGLQLNPITTLYYIAPCSFVFLAVPWAILELPVMTSGPLKFDFWIFFSNALAALALNFAVFLVLGRTGAVTVRVAGILKDWMIISLSTLVFPDAMLTTITIGGYAIALAGVVVYNYIRSRDVAKVSAVPAPALESLPVRRTD
eukprot:TRINITY_DN29528_c0_g1_i1.p1 TRINITY_DN29528_c0_g1~~TRINITY_DN29528_c0_g1_i1.p1  ORF type:complete len:331 (-),score=49.22 TRINITY_DN29528_c0_g1_i1:1312-2304(-)